MYKTAIKQLADAFGDKLSLSAALRKTHGHDESSHTGKSPDAVLFAHTTDDVALAVKICAANTMPIIAYGAGTSLEGQIIPTRGGLTVDMSHMNRVLQVNCADMDVRVEAGITREDLNRHLRDQGLFFPIDPGANCTLGGMVATRASGTNAVRYGTMREQLLSLKVVTANGDIIETGTRARKSAAGYDLTHLFAGSEGTLGITTEISLRVHGIPEMLSAGVCRFPSLKAAVDTAITTIQMGLPISRIELMDELSIQAVNAHSKTTYPEAPTLFLEFSGSSLSVADQIRSFEEIALDMGGSDIEFANTQEAINALWHARHNILYATKALAPTKSTITTDICVPISELATCMMETRKDIEQSGLLATILGHVGDGNFHTIILVDEENPAEANKATALNVAMVERALKLGGTCTGEHGIGLGKREFLQQEKASAIPLMQTIKNALDPKGIMNPGKIF
ncbi:MAG: FAD-binding protein [Kordiimonadaceae bacterium]|nr:FAD-binding protein [Kordiimonadaceae bacterium]